MKQYGRDIQGARHSMNRTAILLGAFGVVCLAGSLVFPLLAPVFAVAAFGFGAVCYRTGDDGTTRRVGLGLLALGLLLAAVVVVAWAFLTPTGGSVGVQAG